MATIWVFSEDAQLNARLSGLAHSLVSGPEDRIAGIAIDPKGAEVVASSGVDTVYLLKGESPWPEAYAGAIAELAADAKPDLVLIASTPRGKDIAAAVAARLKAGLVTEAFTIRRTESGFETDRLMYGGLAICTESLEELFLVTVPAANFEPSVTKEGQSSSIKTIEVNTATPALVGDVCPIPRTGADITAAERVVCVGRGIAKKEDLGIAEDLAASLDAALGCTRSIAEDYAWMPEETYIGLSGQKVRPKLYLSLGVSGQVQHVSGIRDSKIIVGVDMNENAPIFAAADYGIVGDLYEIAPLITAALKARTG